LAKALLTAKTKTNYKALARDLFLAARKHKNKLN